MKNIFNFFYYGINSKITTNNKLFFKLFKSKFNGFSSSNNTKVLLRTSASISFKQVKHFSKKSLDKQYSNTVSVTNNLDSVLTKYYYLDAKVQTTINLNKSLNIDIEYQESFIFNVLNFLSRNTLKKQLFQNIIKTDIEQVLLHLLVNKNNLHCLHAAAVEKDGQVMLFAGLNGVGKSTIVQYLIKNNKYFYFGDNYILIDSNKAYKSLDIARLSNESIKHLNSVSTESFGFEKNIIQNIKISKLNSASISDIFWVTRSNNYLNKLSNNKLFKLIKKLQLIENEEVLNSKLTYILENNSKNKLNNKIKFHKLELSSFKDLEKLSNDL